MAADPAAANGFRFADFRPPDVLNQAAFDRYYNLDYDAAIQDFERIAAPRVVDLDMQEDALSGA